MADIDWESSKREAKAVEDLSLFETDLFIPAYKPGKWESWEIRHADLCLDHGYVTGLWMVKDLPVLYKREKDRGRQAETWMSPSAYEIESQEIGCRYSYGRTVVAGLGLGWSAVNAALLPGTTRVEVLELDPLVISIIEELEVFERLDREIRNKISVIETNAMAWQPEGPVDFLYADIWAKHGQRKALDDVRRMQENIGASSIYFWGQELIIYHEAGKPDGKMEKISNEEIEETVEKIGLPLFLPEDRDYAGMINQVIANRIKRGLPLIR